MNYNAGAFKLIWGGALNQYSGKHFGRVMWAQFAGNNPMTMNIILTMPLKPMQVFIRKQLTHLAIS